MLCRSLIAALLLVAGSFAHAGPASFERDIVVVDFDDESAAALKRNMNRPYLADMIDKLVAAKVKAVVVKVFLDSPGNEAVDARLEQAVKSGRVLLQATISADPPVSSELQERFSYRGATASVKPNVSGPAGWLPTARLQAAAAKVCFVDVRDINVAPIVVELSGRLYKSMYACVLEEATGSELSSLGPTHAQFGSERLPVTKDAGVAIALTNVALPERVAAQDVLGDKVDASRLRGKIAVLTYTGSKSPTYPIAGAPVKVHQAFLAVLRDVMGATTGP